jgi:hypothetical protein
VGSRHRFAGCGSRRSKLALPWGSLRRIASSLPLLLLESRRSSVPAAAGFLLLRRRRLDSAQGSAARARLRRQEVFLAKPRTRGCPSSLLHHRCVLTRGASFKRNRSDLHVGAVFPNDLHTSEIPILSSFSFSVCS